MVELGKCSVQFLADFLALQRSRSREDGDLSHNRRQLDYPAGAFKLGGFPNEIPDFVLHEWDVCSQSVGRKPSFNELENIRSEADYKSNGDFTFFCSMNLAFGTS